MSEKLTIPKIYVKVYDFELELSKLEKKIASAGVIMTRTEEQYVFTPGSDRDAWNNVIFHLGRIFQKTNSI